MRFLGFAEENFGVGGDADAGMFREDSGVLADQVLVDDQLVFVAVGRDEGGFRQGVDLLGIEEGGLFGPPISAARGMGIRCAS